MEFSIADLLANFTDDKLVAPKVLEKKLNCDDDKRLRQLQIALDALEKIGLLVKERGKYRRVREEGLIEGKLRCSSKGFCFAIQDVEGAEDIYVRESQLGTAWNGDRVLVRVTKEGRRRRSPEGEVRLILERANPSVLARVKQTNTELRAIPLDDRLLFELDLQANGQSLTEVIDHLVHVEILRYPLGQMRPLGRITQSLGNDDQSASDLDIVCCKHDLPRNFPPELLQAIQEIPDRLAEANVTQRLDLRHLKTLSLKPTINESMAESLDDAITLERLESGQWQLGIHITDVVAFIAAQSPLDREAQKRGTSVYLGDAVLPMLPEEFCQRHCSLLPGQDRLAVSVLLTLDNAGTVVEFEIQPTVIRVDHLLSYQLVQAILEYHSLSQQNSGSDLPEAIQDLAPVLETVVQLHALSQALQQQRQARGAFELNLPDTKFHYDDEGALGAMVVSAAQPARAMVVELMLLANQVVASHLQALAVPGIYRIHPSPDPDDVQDLIKLAQSMQMDVSLEQDEVVRPQDYQRLTQHFAQSSVEKVLTYLLLSTLKPAVYSTTPKPHFGLALDQGYTHFTSPLRRYPDLLVQRVLHAVFEQGRDRRSTRAKESVNLRHSSCHGKVTWNVLPTEVQEELETHFASMVVYLSECEKEALEAEEDVEGLKKAGFMRERIGEVFRGLITGVQSYGLFVEIEELLIEGLVHVSSLKDDWYEYRSRPQVLVGRRNRKQYRLGDLIAVQVKSVDYYRQQIDLVVVDGGSEPVISEPVISETTEEGEPRSEE
ncbi:ribonuclease R family protein [Neosynechococcus sphagnicola]|uniref:ribonuclease R family protein n=1 Tax=Neosynechococcus sphagnicola TaxID=1501145 RepID=UPI0006920849|nr:ribonuclease R family protein [Neosynechococcus sphagnicola]